MGIKIESFLKDDKSMQKVIKLTDTKLDWKSFLQWSKYIFAQDFNLYHRELWQFHCEYQILHFKICTLLTLQ